MLFTLLGLFGLDTVFRAFNVHSGQTDVDQYGMYRDGNGNYRMKTNKHWVVDTYNDCGEKIIKNVKTGSTEVNIEEIESNKRKQEAQTNGKRFYLYRSESNQKYRVGNQHIQGDRYRPVKGNGVYVIRRISYRNTDFNSNPPCRHYYGQYYMDMNYNICFATEDTLEKDKVTYGLQCGDIHDFIIKKANEYIKTNLHNPLYSNSFNLDVEIEILDSSKDMFDKLKEDNKKWRRTRR